MQGRKTMNKWALCALAVGVAFGAAPGRAADAVTVGILDEVRLGEGYTAYRTKVAELSARAKQLEEQLKAREVLDAVDGRKFDDMIAKPTLTTAETTAFSAVIATGLERRKKYIDYLAKAPRTSDEDKFIKDTETFKKGNELIVNRLGDNMFQDLQKREKETDKEFIDKANLEVQKVAVDKKLSFVLRKDAVAWFSPSVDITDEVLKRLNRQ